MDTTSDRRGDRTRSEDDAAEGGTGPLDVRVDVDDLLLRTDWHAVDHCCPDVAPEMPVILRALLDEDPHEQGHALRSLSEALSRQQVFYTANAPAARFVAAVLRDPRTRALVTDRDSMEEDLLGPQAPFPLRVGLLEWLGDSVAEALAQRDRPYGDAEDLEAVLDLAPELYDAVHPLLAADTAEVRGAALAAVLPMLRLPALAERIPAVRAQVLTLAHGEHPHRWRALDTLAAWGEDVTALF
ncbi:hypothetical protein [Streptomyces sp. NRRL S-87]|uniref:hypothetical protein n=1 Tax=Streptomyces sp. NRRL S-87 TaxID=1463920 RepID=UPI0004BEA4C1|nr:hypothetical protein [Streptomyces sp. NRRL S-87]